MITQRKSLGIKEQAIRQCHDLFLVQSFLRLFVKFYYAKMNVLMEIVDIFMLGSCRCKYFLLFLHSN